MENINVKSNLTTGKVSLLSIACGLAVANVYYAQPLLDTMGQTFHFETAKVGIIITISQIGYGLGLVFLVPLGDMLNARKLIFLQYFFLGIFLLLTGLASSSFLLLSGMFLVGLMAVVTQTLVAYAANMADNCTRGRIVGTVTGGVVIGLLLARTIAGTLALFGGWRSVYIVSSILVIIMSFILLRFLPAVEKPKAVNNYIQLLTSIFSLFIHNSLFLKRSIIAMLIFATGQILWTPMVLPLSQPPFSLSTMAIGLLGLAGAAGAIGAAKAGSFVDQGYKNWTSGIGLLLMLVSWLLIALIHHSLLFLILGIIAFDMGLQVVHVTNQSLILNIDSKARSRVTGGYMIFYSIGSAAGSIASTVTYANWGWEGVCLLGVVIGLVALLIWWISR